MRVSRELGILVAREALVEPFRQIEVLPTEKFRVWMRARGVRFSEWQSLHFLWKIGLARPVAVRMKALELTPELEIGDRFVEVESGRSEPTFVDLGINVKSISTIGPGQPKLHSSLRDSLLWHPFQLLELLDLSEILDNRMAIDMTLKGPEACGRFAEKLTDISLTGAARFAQDPRRLAAQEILALLLMVEPLMHPVVHGHVSVRPTRGETFDGYLIWQEQLDSPGLLERAGMTLDRAKDWHRELSTRADILDPIDHFRVLMQHVNREDRLRLKTEALAAHELYDQAELLRRYLEEFHGCELYEEDDYRTGPRSLNVKRARYGTHRTGDADRKSRWRIIRDFGLDAQVRATWFLEGPTEVAFFARLAELQEIELEGAGLLLFNLGGNAGHDRNSVLRHLLRQHLDSGAFAFIALDRDVQSGTTHIDNLKRMSRQGLLTAGFHVWDPDFEEENFSAGELAAAATSFAQSQGMDVLVTEAELRARMKERSHPAGRAIEGLLRQQKLYDGKGADWGNCLAEIAFASAVDRPALEVFKMLLNAQWSDFDGTIEHLVVDEKGTLVDRSRGSHSNA